MAKKKVKIVDVEHAPSLLNSVIENGKSKTINEHLVDERNKLEDENSELLASLEEMRIANVQLSQKLDLEIKNSAIVLQNEKKFFNDIGLIGSFLSKKRSNLENYEDGVFLFGLAPDQFGFLLQTVKTGVRVLNGFRQVSDCENVYADFPVPVDFFKFFTVPFEFFCTGNDLTGKKFFQTKIRSKVGCVKVIFAQESYKTFIYSVVDKKVHFMQVNLFRL